MVTTLPKVSVVTITYNAERYLERTMQSVLEQSYPNVEYVIIDGASTDGTLDIVERYREGVDILVSEPDKGLYDAMNKAMQHLTGDYLVFMNAGDRFASAETLAAAMEGSNGADLVYGLALNVDEAGHTRPWHKKTPPPHRLSERSFMNGMVTCHQCMVLKTSCAVPYDRSYRIAADIDWSIRCMKRVQTKHFYDAAVFCLFLEGGVSDERRWKALGERLRISAKHFGWPAALWQQVVIGWGALRRGSLD